MTSSAVSLAREFAVEAHGEQMYGVHPYVYHLDKVADVLKYFSQYNPKIAAIQMIQAAYLHDTLEDTATHYSELKEVFGEEVANLVYDVTDELGKNRRERHAKTYPKTAGNTRAVILKLADRIANVHCCLTDKDWKTYSMYKNEYQDFREALFRPTASVVFDGYNEMWRHLDILLRGL